MAKWTIHSVVLNSELTQITGVNWQVVLTNGDSSMGSCLITPVDINASSDEIIDAVKTSMGTEEVSRLETIANTPADNLHRSFPLQTEEEKLSQKLRYQRNQLLLETDWWGSSDLVMTDAQKSYRQTLRQIPQEVGFPFETTFPTYPQETN